MQNTWKELDRVVDTLGYLVEAFDAEEVDADDQPLSLSSAERRERYAQTMREM
jgi:hypothetical protein